MSKHTYIYFGNYAKTNFGVEGIPGPQILVEFRDEDDRSDGKAFGLTAFRAGADQIRVDAVEHLNDFDCSNGDEIRCEWHKERDLFCHNLGIVPLLNTLCLMRAMRHRATYDAALTSALAAIIDTDRIGEVLSRLTDAIVEMEKYIIYLKRLPTKEVGISGSGCHFRQMNMNGDWKDLYHCPDSNKTVSRSLYSTNEPGWHIQSSFLVLTRKSSGGKTADPIRFYDLDDPCTWFDSPGAYHEKNPADAVKQMVPDAPKSAVFSVEARYGVLPEKAYEVLELASELGREYLKIRNEKGEEIWIDRSKAVKTS